ncbi:hypothetical protein DRO97_06300 [Archaeoglobales archaeon]|nr:MAG: hypothetical protein DRO97_06300 [Archaeoglobales archaeon]
MNLDLKRNEKDEYISFLLRQYRLVDALWFLAVEDKFGLDIAVELNEKIWEDIGRRAAREMKRRFKIEEGLKGFVKAIRYFPWSIIVGYEIEEKDDKVTIKVPHCPPQEARLKMGRKEYPCKEMHMKEFKSFAAEIDGKIEVKCLFAPPDKHKDYWCMWEFVISD